MSLWHHIRSRHEEKGVIYAVLFTCCCCFCCYETLEFILENGIHFVPFL
ncbi:hypothetical protein V6Z11_A05G021700 [Gossypium hirsutum]